MSFTPFLCEKIGCGKKTIVRISLSKRLLGQWHEMSFTSVLLEKIVWHSYYCIGRSVQELSEEATSPEVFVMLLSDVLKSRPRAKLMPFIEVSFE